MARKNLKQVASIHNWSDKDLEDGARIIVREVIADERLQTEATLLMSLILNEAHRRREQN